MKIVKFRLTGECPLLMHSERGANPLDKEVQAHKKLTSKRQKTEEDFFDVAWSDYKLAIYYDPILGPYIPAQNIDRTFQEGAKKNKLGKKFASSARCVNDKIALIYDGPKDVKSLYDEGFVDVRSVVVGQARISRVRPMFRDWALEFDFAYDENQLDEDSVIMAATVGGQLIGLCDYRPRFGRFTTEVVK